MTFGQGLNRMSLITIRTSSTRVDAYLSGIFAMAEAVLSKDESIDSEKHWFTVSIDQKVEQRELNDACDDS